MVMLPAWTSPPSISLNRVHGTMHRRMAKSWVEPLWLTGVIDWVRTRYRSVHRRVKNGTCALLKSWSEYRMNHRVNYSAPHHRPGNPTNGIWVVKYRVHGSAIKRPTPV